MKELYELPEFELSLFDIEDIITASTDEQEVTTGNLGGGDFDGGSGTGDDDDFGNVEDDFS